MTRPKHQAKFQLPLDANAADYPLKDDLSLSPLFSLCLALRCHGLHGLLDGLGVAKELKMKDKKIFWISLIVSLSSHLMNIPSSYEIALFASAGPSASSDNTGKKHYKYGIVCHMISLYKDNFKDQNMTLAPVCLSEK